MFFRDHAITLTLKIVHKVGNIVQLSVHLLNLGFKKCHAFLSCARGYTTLDHIVPSLTGKRIPQSSVRFLSNTGPHLTA